MLSRFERACERIIEGSIASAFRLRVQPAEIGRRLERAMLDGRVTSVGTTLGPNAFDVRLHPEDAQSFADWDTALCREMETWLAELAFARGLATIGPIAVRIVADADIRRRSVVAVARFDADARPGRSESSGRAIKSPVLRLRPIVEGIPGVILTAVVVTVGRATDNELVIADPGVSRHHARLVPEGNAWSVVDLASTNGTWLNGKRITQAAIEAGDELSFGGVAFTIDAG